MTQRSPSTRRSPRPQRDRPARAQRPARSGGQKAAPQPRTAGEFAVPTSGTPALPAVHAFADMDLPAPLLDTLTRQGVTVPFPIQAATLPNALAGRDVLGRGRTGSGKTLAFGLALLARTAGHVAAPRRPLALVLVPTRELAQQVTDALTPHARALRLRTATVVGGVSLSRQIHVLRAGAEILVATPGRLKDLIERGDCELGDVRVAVLDEADQMADMGFLPQVTALLKQVEPDGQRMLFSATLDAEVDRLVRRFLTDPVVHSVDPSAGVVTDMHHHLLHVASDDKLAVAAHIGAREGRVLMFRDTKRSVDRLTKSLLNNGVRAVALHGGRTQPQRNRALDHFRSGEATVLVATNIAARGIHIDDLDLVVNVDPPTDPKDYVHRGGRTARAGASGSVVTLVLPEERRDMDRLLKQARVDATALRARPGDDELARLTGARTPSGIPVALPTAAPATPQKAASSSRAGRGRNGGKGSTGGNGTGSKSTTAARGRSRRSRNPQSRKKAA
ncbi:DEAD/DEAH box helicase [Streptomyces sp. NBC_01795]|uniref:DEAD/DEAH box helicase n=2 Tax=Streptomyces TaxID=1883 RepID=UPI002DDBB22C|nr:MULTISPECIES: DEAD/DEAH box helicase [unclassified Streptomyces]WSA91162.1 DEAD/DEAH box helicase [Streptomyces sp. NBC_01795]WSB75487.1 DEAD/DEAH box helicase [Streptomyces sp. NBC_01775]WSS16230.1 DEAD/DEAH box helicase [Streptomyces sp. NBC_01186]